MISCFSICPFGSFFVVSEASRRWFKSWILRPKRPDLRLLVFWCIWLMFCNCSEYVLSWWSGRMPEKIQTTNSPTAPWHHPDIYLGAWGGTEHLEIGTRSSWQQPYDLNHATYQVACGTYGYHKVTWVVIVATRAPLKGRPSTPYQSSFRLVRCPIDLIWCDIRWFTLIHSKLGNIKGLSQKQRKHSM